MVSNPKILIKNGQRGKIGMEKLATRIDASPKLDFSVDQRSLKNLLKKLKVNNFVN